MPKNSNNFMKYSGMAFQMGAIIFLGVWGGTKLDEYFQFKNPLFTLFAALFSVSTAIYLSIKDFLK